MVNGSHSSNSGVVPETPHKCGLTCLGPLTFHCGAVGAEVSLSEGGRLAERRAHTFKNGLVFSSRPVKVEERIRLRVEKDVFLWHGALRVGFTTVPPSDRRLPLPSMAMPDLTCRPGHWAAPVHESCCAAGSEVEFWVSSRGNAYVRSNQTNVKRKIRKGVNLSKPLWAIVDIYGQTCCVFLLGSEKKSLFYTRRSCPAPTRPTSPCLDILAAFIPRSSSNSTERMSFDDTEEEEPPIDEQCVVCMGRKATVTLPCGHRCLCEACDLKVIHVFNKCPLCRHKIVPVSTTPRAC